MINGEDVYINGDGETSRDFCYIDNVVQMNLLAATAEEDAKDEVYNVAVGDRTTLNDLFYAIKNALNNNDIKVEAEPIYREFRVGDVRHSQADTSKSREKLLYDGSFKINEGISNSILWYVEFLK